MDDAPWFPSGIDLPADVVQRIIATVTALGGPTDVRREVLQRYEADLVSRGIPEDQIALLRSYIGSLGNGAAVPSSSADVADASKIAIPTK